MEKPTQIDDLFEDQPPAYSQTNPAIPTIPTPSASSSAPIPSLFSLHLRDLPHRILSAQSARSSTRAQRDSEILSLLVPEVEQLLNTIAAMEHSPSLMEMTIVPEAAVGNDWRFSDEGNMRPVVKVREEVSKDKKEQHHGPVPPAAEAGLLAKDRQRQFDDFGWWEDDDKGAQAHRDVLWWDDFDFAARLAKYLEPEAPKPPPQPSMLQELIRPQPTTSNSRKSSRWGLFQRADPPPPPTPPSPAAVQPRAEIKEEKVTMTVRPEEVTFRRENEMGIWESKTGWGIIVRVRIRR